MRVCFVSGSYPPVRCGIGDYLQQLCHALSEQGTSVDVITSAESGIARRDAEVHLWPEVRNWSLACLPVVKRLLSQIQPDIVNIQYPTQAYGRRVAINLMPAYVRHNYRVPVLTTIHEYSTFRRLGRARVTLSALTSTAIVFPDPDNLALFSSGPFCRTRCHYIPLGPNIVPDRTAPQDRQQLRSSYGAGLDDIVVAYFGFVSPSKGLETLIDAIAIALSRHPETPLRLLLIADDQPSEPAFSEYHRRVTQAAKVRIPPSRIHWTGYRSAAEVSAYLSSADIAVFPFADGASLRRTTLLTALCHGLPVLSTTNSLSSTHLSPGNGVVLVPPADPESLAEAIAALAGDSGRRLELSSRARSFARTLDWSSIASSTAALYRTLVEESRENRR